MMDCASVEFNLDIVSAEFAKAVKQTFDSIIKEDCVEVLENEYESRHNFIQRILQQIS